MKAPGLDGWSAAELKLIPDFLLQWIALLFESAEQLGKWPDELQRSANV